MSDTQKSLLVRLSDLQAEIDRLKLDIKKTEKPKGTKTDANSN